MDSQLPNYFVSVTPEVAETIFDEQSRSSGSFSDVEDQLQEAPQALKKLIADFYGLFAQFYRVFGTLPNRGDFFDMPDGTTYIISSRIIQAESMRMEIIVDKLRK